MPKLNIVVVESRVYVDDEPRDVDLSLAGLDSDIIHVEWDGTTGLVVYNAVGRKKYKLLLGERVLTDVDEFQPLIDAWNIAPILDLPSTPGEVRSERQELQDIPVGSLTVEQLRLEINILKKYLRG